MVIFFYQSVSLSSRMWKVLQKFVGRPSCHQVSTAFLAKRFFLSEAFKLENAWNERLHSSILSKINTNDMFYELDNQFQHFGVASALDIDIFVNAVNDDSSFDEVEDIVHKLRLSPEAINLLPSTHHALIRLYMKYDKTDDLIRILDDRLNYGIFSDSYCTLLLIDKFIKEGNLRDAAKVCTINMLQEDLSNPLINHLSLYSCHKYLDNPVPWKEEKAAEEREEEDDDDEIEKVRVRYIRNPYFDDHFDLVNPNHLIGKTFTLIGTQMNDPIGRTYKLLGLLLHGKLYQLKDYVSSLLVKKEANFIVKDGLISARKVLDENLKCEGEESHKALAKEIDELLNNLFSDPNLLDENNLLTLVETRTKDLVNKMETLEIKKQLQLYKEWEEHRNKLLKEQISRIKKEKQLDEIKTQKQVLQEKEEELFFFDNEEKLDLIIEEKERQKQREIEIEKQRLEKKKNHKPRAFPKPERKKVDPPFESYFDENIPMKLVKTKL